MSHAVPVIYVKSTRPIDVAAEVNAQLPRDFTGPYEVRVPCKAHCWNCGPQQYSGSERYASCPVCGGPLGPPRDA